ncbi:HEAT repeat domain-containing protein [Streptomyces sp. NPDC002734]|uniref:HEAT repeat domain-containing protein n=1 Tax=Streptomyces sp. NPDC002734 TaxID=3154426 RepID=UPI003333FCA2
MFNGLHDIDWSSMDHAYGTADEIPDLLTALRSPDAEVRDKALDRYYGAVHHQGDVYACTTASLPFLFELVADETTPGRDAIVRLLVGIAGTSVERCESEYIGDVVDYVGAAAVLRERADAFVGWAADDDVRVRRAALPAVGLLIDDTRRALAVLRDRLAMEDEAVVLPAILDAAAELALRLPQAKDEAVAWFTALAVDEGAGPLIRLAAVVQRVRCAPLAVDAGVVPTAIALLRESANGTVSVDTWADPPTEKAPAAAQARVPPQVAAVFEDMERQNTVHSSTTGLLSSFHEALAWRVRERTELLEEQLRSPDLGSRLDAIRMSGTLMKGWRGDHTRLILLVADQLKSPHPDVAAEAGALLSSCAALAGPAREALAAKVADQREAYGPQVWASERPQLRRAHQEAVRALARVGDDRALPDLLFALDSGVDAWRAVEVAGALPQSAGQLTPRLCDRLHGVDLSQEWVDMSVNALLSTLSRLGDPVAVPVIAETLAEAVRQEQGGVTRSAVRALAGFGTVAAAALGPIRALTGSPGNLRSEVVAALWAIGRDHEEVLPPLLEMLDSGKDTTVADVLGDIGRPAATALPRLRELLSDDYEWVRVHSAAAVWDIAGEEETATVLDVLLEAWQRNHATATFVVACLNRMGLAARPALPQLLEELARQQRDRYADLTKDEALRRSCQALVARLA